MSKSALLNYYFKNIFSSNFFKLIVAAVKKGIRAISAFLRGKLFSKIPFVNYESAFNKTSIFLLRLDSAAYYLFDLKTTQLNKAYTVYEVCRIIFTVLKNLKTYVVSNSDHDSDSDPDSEWYLKWYLALINNSFLNSVLYEGTTILNVYCIIYTLVLTNSHYFFWSDFIDMRGNIFIQKELLKYKVINQFWVRPYLKYYSFKDLCKKSGFPSGHALSLWARLLQLATLNILYNSNFNWLKEVNSTARFSNWFRVAYRFAVLLQYGVLYTTFFLRLIYNVHTITQLFTPIFIAFLVAYSVLALTTQTLCALSSEHKKIIHKIANLYTNAVLDSLKHISLIWVMSLAKYALTIKLHRSGRVCSIFWNTAKIYKIAKIPKKLVKIIYKIICLNINQFKRINFYA